MKTLSALSAAIYGIIYVRIPKKSRVTKRILGRKIFAAVIVVRGPTLHQKNPKNSTYFFSALSKNNSSELLKRDYFESCKSKSRKEIGCWHWYRKDPENSPAWSQIPFCIFFRN